MPDAVPTLMGGVDVLMSVQGEEGVRYTPLSPLCTIEVYVIGRIVLLVLGS